MTITYNGHPVRILDTFEMGGHKLASIEATEGRPFVGGDRWPVWTKFTTVRYDLLRREGRQYEAKDDHLRDDAVIRHPARSTCSEYQTVDRLLT